MITGQEEPDAGKLELGDTVKLAYVDQSRDDARSRQDGVGGDLRRRGPAHARRAQGQLAPVHGRLQLQGLRPAETRRGALRRRAQPRAPGEGARAPGGNLLLLDEPTNDLDVDTLRALEQALLAFPGCAMVISHDRWFLDRVATHVLAFEGDSQVSWFEGNFEAYEEHRRTLLGASADRPHRITYKRLVRG